MEQDAWAFAYPLAVLFGGVLTVLVATVPLAWWLKGRSRPSFGVAVIVSGGIAGVAIAAGVMLPIAVGLGDGPSNDSIHLLNASDSELFLVSSITDSDGHSRNLYSRLGPGDDASLRGEVSLRVINGYCTMVDRSKLIRLPPDHKLARFKDPSSGQQVTEDPDPAIVTEVSVVPGGWCFPDRLSWIEWDGSTFTQVGSPQTGLVTQLVTAALIPIGMVLALGAGLDTLLARYRRSRLDGGAGLDRSGPGVVA